MNPERPPLYALTGIRFVAAMLVVCFHCSGRDAVSAAECDP
jgi:peptidoglycan/LPS O-acetylase OafA/YrhL